MCRCKWVNLNNKRYVAYHDNEWGKAKYDDNVLFEFLVLEMFQAGLIVLVFLFCPCFFSYEIYIVYSFFLTILQKITQNILLKHQEVVSLM